MFSLTSFVNLFNETKVFRIRGRLQGNCHFLFMGWKIEVRICFVCLGIGGCKYKWRRVWTYEGSSTSTWPSALLFCTKWRLKNKFIPFNYRLWCIYLYRLCYWMLEAWSFFLLIVHCIEIWIYKEKTHILLMNEVNVQSACNKSSIFNRASFWTC